MYMKRTLILFILVAGSSVASASDYVGLSPKAMEFLFAAHDTCAKAKHSDWKVTAAMAHHDEYIASQSEDCRVALAEFNRHLDCVQRCTAVEGAKWAKGELAGFTGRCRLAGYLSGVKSHPFSEEPSPKLTGIYMDCTAKCMSQSKDN